MATPARKPVSATTNSSPRRPALENSQGRPPSTSAVPSSTGQGLARGPSVRQSRPTRRLTARMSQSYTTDPDIDQDEDERSTNAQLIAHLKEQMQRAEQAAEQYRKQVELMQKRLDESASEQTMSEERDFQRQTQLDHLQADIKEAARQRRELDLAHESEKRLLLQERERQSSKEAELQSVISRLNETLRHKSLERSNISRAGSMRDQPQPTDGSPHSQIVEAAAMDSYLHTLQEKDQSIEHLRLELADFHLRSAQQEQVGDSHLQVLERQVTEFKVQNARLQEENESFQMLLSEKTLKGDFMSESRVLDDATGMSTLAEELETVNDDPDMHTEAYKKLEAELKAVKEDNKGLTLYIDKIIGRILQHEGFEHLVLNNKDEKETPPPKPVKPMPLKTMEKALPATPADDMATPTSAASVSSAAQSFLKRAGSVMSRSGNVRPSSPMSIAQAPPPTANENQHTAPSIPLNRGHRRARSDQAQQDLPGAALVVQQMNRGSPLRTVSGGPTSPGISPAFSPQVLPKTSYFPAPQQHQQHHQHSPRLAPQNRPPSNSGQTGHGSSRDSITSDHSIERSSTEASSIPSSVAQNLPSGIPGAVMKQSQLRPLRLVQERSREEEEAQKRANRGSWIGWFRGSAVEAQNDEQSMS